MKKVFNLLIITLFAMLLCPKSILAVSLDSVLKDGKLVIPSIPFETSMMSMDTIYSYFYDTLEVFELSVNDCNANYTHCTLSNGEDSSSVDVVWEYDEDIKKIVDAIAEKYPTDVTEYVIDDIEILNMHINGGGIVSNSLEFKKNIQYKNFYIDQRGGGAPELIGSAIGMLKFKVDGTLYWKGDRDPAFISHDIVYVSENVTDIASALQSRLEKLFPDHTFEVSITDDPIQRVIDDYIDDSTTIYNNNTAYYISDGYATLEDFLATRHEYDFLDGAEEYLYDIAVDDAFGFQVAVKKDSSKAVDSVDIITNDVLTSVSIKVLGDAILPLDTRIQVERITTGDDYTKLINKLKVKDTNSETYDLKLYSKSINDYISEIENGKFEVSIPISEKFEGKTLIVYYVDSDDNIETHEVTVKDGYATFITDHFSTYTLAALSDDSNPNTGDNLVLYILLLGLSVIGFVGFYTKQRKLFN